MYDNNMHGERIKKIIIITIAATGSISNSKSLRRYLNNTPGKHEIKELQKTAIFGTAPILRKVLM